MIRYLRFKDVLSTQVTLTRALKEHHHCCHHLGSHRSLSLLLPRFNLLQIILEPNVLTNTITQTNTETSTSTSTALLYCGV